MFESGHEVKFCRKVEAFAQASRRARTNEHLKDLLCDICDDIGLKYFALVHHVDFRRKNDGIVLLHNYPDEWVEYFIKENLFSRDPIHRASQTTILGFAWLHVPKMIKLTTEDRDVLRAAQRAGIGDGFTIPAHIPGEANGSCSFATTPDKTIRQDQVPIAQHAGGFAFEAARRLARSRDRIGQDRRPLTARQRECVTLVAQGKTDWEISRILGISHETVIQHLKLARERYGVTKRTMLTVQALYDGSISFSEVLG